MKYTKVYLSILIALVLLPFISSQGINTQFAEELDISYPKNFYVSNQHDFYIHAHVTNVTTLLNKTDASCQMHLYDKYNNHLIRNSTPHFEIRDFEWNVKASNITTSGMYTVIIECNTSRQAGFVSYEFVSNPLGREYSISQSITYVLMILLVLIVMLSCILGIMKIQPGNIRNDDGQLLKINYKKYIRWLLMGITYVCIVALTYFAWNISWAYLEFSALSNFFHMLFRLEMILTIPIMIVSLILALVYYLQDKKWDEMLARGLHPR